MMGDINKVPPPRRRRSILKSKIEVFPVFIEESIRTLELDDVINGHSDSAVPKPDFTFQTRRRVSFGSSFIKEFHTASFEDDGGKSHQSGEDMMVCDTRNITRFNNIDMDLGVPNFDETYIVCGENKENSPVPQPDQNATFSVSKIGLSSVPFGSNPGNWLTFTGKGGRIWENGNMDMTHVGITDMDISQCDSIPSRVRVERKFFNTATSRIENATIRLPNIMDLSVGADDSQISKDDSGFKSTSLSLNSTKTFYGGEMSLCKELLYDTRRKFPVKENPALTWALPITNSPRHVSFVSQGSDNSQNSTFVVNRLPEMTGHPDSVSLKNLFPKNMDSKSLSPSFVECLDDQLEPSLYQSAIDPSVTHDIDSDSDSAATMTEFHGITISTELQTFIKRNDAIHGSERVKYMDGIMEEIINMPLGVYKEFCQTFGHCLNPSSYMQSIEIHRRLKKDLDAAFIL